MPHSAKLLLAFSALSNSADWQTGSSLKIVPLPCETHQAAQGIHYIVISIDYMTTWMVVLELSPIWSRSQWRWLHSDSSAVPCMSPTVSMSSLCPVWVTLWTAIEVDIAPESIAPISIIKTFGSLGGTRRCSSSLKHRCTCLTTKGS